MAGGCWAEGFAAGVHAAAYYPGVVAEEEQAAAEEYQGWFAVFPEVAVEATYEGHQAVVAHADRGSEQAPIAQGADDLVREDALGNHQG